MRSAVFMMIRMASLVLCAALTLSAQSTDQNFPTPVTSNEIAGSIKARDIGDARLTSYFYAFNGSQGDIFINVVTRNFSGDIDVFTADDLRPLTKMVMYADAGVTETGRLVYLRKPERLLLRVEGRTPNDDPAVFRIKFAGSFIALANQKTEEAPKIETSGEVNESGVRVNSVGTIVEVIPKPPKPKKVVTEVAENTLPAKSEAPASAKTESASKIVPDAPVKTDETKTETVFENSAAKVTVEPPPKTTAKRPPRAASRTAKATAKKTPPPPAEEKPDPLASIRLVVELKDGTVIERPMSEVSRFNVVNGILSVTGKDGKVAKYSILDVAKVTIQ